MTTNKCNCGCEVCGTKKVMYVTQIDSRKVLDPENVAKRGDIMLISKNLNGVWTLTPVSKVSLNAVAEAMADDRTSAFLLMEWKEPTDEPTRPENPGTTDPQPGTGGETTDPSGSEDGSGTEDAGDGNG